MSEDAAGAAGFEVASAYVSVSPDAESFEEQLDAQVGGLQYVVKIPVVPDTGDFAGEVDTAVGESKTTVTVPVIPDTEGFQLLIDNAVEEAKASVTIPVVPDTEGFPEAVEASVSEADKPVEVPVVPDMSGFTETTDTEAGAAGEEAGATFAERLAATVESGLNPVWPEAFAGAGPAGEEAGGLWGRSFAAAAEPGLSDILNTWAANVIAPAGTAGEEAGAEFASRFTAAASAIPEAMVGLGGETGLAFGSRFGAALEGTIPQAIPGMIEGTLPVMGAAGAEAGDVAGAGFLSRFGSMFTGLGATFTNMFSGITGSASAAGQAAGSGFGGRFKSAVMGDISPMEALMGAGFVAVAATMASSFDAAMERIHTQAGVGQGAIAGLSNSVLTLAGQVGVSPDSLAAMLYHVESSFQSVGISGQKAMQLVQTAAEGARVGNANVVDVVNALDATMVSGISGISSYSQAMGALNSIVGSGDMTMQDLADAMSGGLMAAAKAYGQSIYQVGAALATLGDNNIRGAKAATDLRMAWQAVEKPLTTAGSALSQLGLTQTTLANEMTQHGLTAALQLFVSHLEASKIPVSQWGEYVTTIFGKRAGVGIQVLMDQLDRLKGKLPDIEKGAHTFASAWAATKQTTSQDLKDLESGFEALLIKIGNGLLPAVDGFLRMLDRDLPSIERFGQKVADLAAPAVKLFFLGLETILHELFGPLHTVTIAVGGLGLALLGLSMVNPWLALIAGLITLVGAIVKYHKEILDTIHKYWHEIEIFLAALAFGFPVIAIFAAITVAVIKYHKQIFDVIEKTWDKITGFFRKTAKDITDIFDDIKKDITDGFDKWWKSHGEELETVWRKAWTVIKDVFQIVWDGISTVLKVEWAIIASEVKTGLDILAAIWKAAWDTISLYAKTVWDVLAAIFKVWLDTVTTVAKIWWDVLVGIFDVALDLLTGHWSKAWDDIKNTATQVWNALKEFLGTAWNAIKDLGEQVWNNIKDYFVSLWHDLYNLAVQVWNNIRNFLSTAWDDIKGGAVSAFDDLRNDIKSVWDGILHDIEGVVNKIKSIVGDITGLPGKALHAIGGALGDIGLARGGVLAGYAPGHDSISARLSPGEAVLVPEAVRAIGPDTINAINAHYTSGRSGGSYSAGGIVPSFATGGIAGLSPFEAGQAAGQMYQQSYGAAGEMARDGINVTLVYNGTQYPTAEQQRAMMMDLAAAIGVS
jgi:TP901 family phage tail tape measure protein